MISYRFRRRAFMAAMGGGVGLKIALRNLEGSAQGMRSPGRLLVTHWPVGIVAGSSDALWTPTSGSVGGSQALKPFADAGLGPDMTVIRGLATSQIPLMGSGGHEGGTVTMMTGVAPGGTRANCCEGDDAFAAGPSIEQILLQNVAALQRPGQGYANSIADSRTDFGEVSCQCLSYSTNFQSVIRYNNTGPATEAIPLRPILSPLMQYTNMFSGMLPGSGAGGAGGAGGGGGRGGGGAGGATGVPADAMLKALVGKRSVLDFAVEELTQLRGLAPSDARNKLSIHTDAVVAAETSVANAINTRYPNPGGAGGSGAAGASGGSGGSGGGGAGGSSDPACGVACATKPAAPPAVTGMADPNTGRGTGNYYGSGRDMAMQDDAPIHAQVGQAHLDVLKAAFVCDLIRVGTYQWSPGTNHVGFALYPNTTQPYQHHPTSHRIGTSDTTASATLSQLNAAAVFLFNVHTWYFSRHAENFAAWKNAVDGCGNSLLDNTCVPFLTEVQSTGHERSNIPAMIIGGKQLGFMHNRYATGHFTVNQFWGTVAQAFGYASTDAPFAAPIDGLWAKP